MLKAASSAVAGAVLCLAGAAAALPLTNAWSKQPAGAMAWLHSVLFVDQNRGWAAGSTGTLLHTADGGRNWKPTAASTDDQIRDVFFIDELNGWLVCEVNV